LTHDGQRRSADVGTILTLPKMRKTSLSLTLVEVAHSIVLMLWVGSLAGFALVVIPSLPSSLPTQELAVQATLAILERTAFLGCGAGAFLLLTTLLMHLLSLRRTRAVLTQMSLILLMAISSVLSQVLLAPRVNGLLKQLRVPLAGLGSSDPTHLELARLQGIEMTILLFQIVAGVVVVLFAVRRWYRYVPEGRSQDAEEETLLGPRLR